MQRSLSLSPVKAAHCWDFIRAGVIRQLIDSLIERILIGNNVRDLFSRLFLGMEISIAPSATFALMEKWTITTTLERSKYCFLDINNVCMHMWFRWPCSAAHGCGPNLVSSSRATTGPPQVPIEIHQQLCVWCPEMDPIGYRDHVTFPEADPVRWHFYLDNYWLDCHAIGIAFGLVLVTVACVSMLTLN